MAGVRSKRLLPFYFPTRVAHIEDHSEFGRALKWMLDRDVTLVPFTFPDPAFEAIRDQRPIRDDCLEKGRAVTAHPHIPAFLKDERRFDLYSAAVVDYRLLGRDGLEVCKTLKNEGIECLMLSGQISSDRAQQALDEGDIRAYIAKASHDFHIALIQSIADAQCAFFLRMAVKFGFSDPEGLFRKISDPHVTRGLLGLPFEEPTEMYWDPTLPGMLFVDRSGAMDRVVVMPLDRYRQMIEKAASEGAPVWYLDRLKGLQWTSWFGNFGLYDPAIPPQPEMLSPSQVLEGDSGVFLAFKVGNVVNGAAGGFLSYAGWQQQASMHNGAEL